MTQQPIDALAIPIDSGQIIQDVEGKIVSLAIGPRTGSQVSDPAPVQSLKITLLDTVFHKTLSPMPNGSQFMVETSYATRSPVWGRLTDSIKRIWGEGHAFGELEGKRVRFRWATDIKGRRNAGNNNWIEANDLEGWEVVSIDGKTATGQVSMPSMPATSQATSQPEPEVDLETEFLKCADGKEEADFITAVYRSTVLNGSDFMDDVMARQAGALSSYVESGRVIIGDDGKYEVPELHQED